MPSVISNNLLIQWGKVACSIKSGNWGQKILTISLPLSYSNTDFIPMCSPKSSWFAHGCSAVSVNSIEFYFRHLGDNTYTLSQCNYIVIGSQ